MDEFVKIEETVFPVPSGNVRGYVFATMPFKGKQKRIAHAHLLVDETPSVTIEIPKAVPLDQLDALADGLKAFAAKVREHA